MFQQRKISKERERQLLEELMKPPKQYSIQNQNVNLEDYIVLEGKQHGSYSYPDLYVAQHRLSLTPEIETSARTLNLQIQNTAQELTGNHYIGNINWEQALKLNLKANNTTLTLRQAADLIYLILDGIEGKRKVYNGKGQELNKDKLVQTYNELFEIRDPWRGEWLDADFKVHNSVLHINYEHKLDANGNLKPQRTEPLEYCLMEDKRVDIRSWIENSTFQGFPTKKVKEGIFNYWYPRSDNNSVAWFVAGSGWAFLVCDWVPGVSIPALGVRAVKLKITV